VKWNRAKVGRGYINVIKAGLPVGNSYVGVAEYTSTRGTKRRHLYAGHARDGTLCLRKIEIRPGEPSRWARVLTFKANVECTMCSRKLVAWAHREARKRGTP
jgi:hypothetical protein